ncbi:unnamed protein product [Didymodactylos carnosus]|uniref:BHLH domain-containing protein n=1 Tax=Didymodactylos carnosus TaxID=1234261 RepID=A0A813SES4_9BILA|nr:unnamed protein product [Didymodactylos carnosus]CAF0970032.1 unnamed protein product [Didymodactylos carnosus]CAF3583149.1 unnamed protein product [Didymodactylos carnosus]CAF3741480.1 unnamed protein product [Didymodactylos carnosus]
MSPNSQLEHEKRVRREIANSNERRRMQSINTGFQSLKQLIPHSCGEKLSKACILQRAADHIKTLQTDKDRLQTQNEQFRILIKSFQIDSTSVLQAQRRLSTTARKIITCILYLDPDEAVLLLNEKDDEEISSDLSAKLSNDEQIRILHDVKKQQAIIQSWHAFENVAHYVTQKDDRHNRGLFVGTSPRHILSDTQPYSAAYDNRSTSSRAATSSFNNNSQQNTNTLNTNVNHGNVVQHHSIVKSIPDHKRSSPTNTSPNSAVSRSSPTANSNTHNNNTTTIAPLSTATETYFILKQHGGPNIPIQRYKTNSLDSNSKVENDSGIVIVERCHLRTSSMDSNNQQNSSDLTSTMATIPHNMEQTVSRRNLQTIVEAIRHLEGDNVLDSLTTSTEQSYHHHGNDPSTSSINVIATPQLSANTNSTHTSPTITQQPPNQYVYHTQRPVHVYQQHSNYPSSKDSSSTSLEIPARIQQLLNEQFQQQTTATGSSSSYQMNPVNIINYDQEQQQKHRSVVTSPIYTDGKTQEQHNSSLSPQHCPVVTAPPKKRKFTYTEIDDNEQVQSQHHSTNEQQQSLITNLVLLSPNQTPMTNESGEQLVFRHQSRLPPPLLLPHPPRQQQ